MLGRTTVREMADVFLRPAVEAEHRRSIEMAGRVIPDPNASGFVQTAIGGRLAPPPDGFPLIGSKVEAGQLMALVEPSLAAADQSSIRQTKAELDQEIALEERQVARYRTLAAAGTVPKARLEEAELTLQGLRDRRAALDALPMNAEPLVAPVAGIVSKANAAPGLIAETNTEVFHIIDPAKLWVEASLFTEAEIAGSAAPSPLASPSTWPPSPRSTSLSPSAQWTNPWRSPPPRRCSTTPAPPTRNCSRPPATSSRCARPRRR